MPQKPTSLPGLGSLERGQETPDHEEVIGSYLDRLTLERRGPDGGGVHNGGIEQDYGAGRTMEVFHTAV